MNIKLDWEVESEAGWSEIGEDPAVIKARQRRSRQLRNLALVLAAIAALSAGLIGWRLRQAARQLRANLESTILAETTALRMGDEASYLRVQADAAEWQRIQRRTYAEYQSLEDRIQADGKIVELDITANRARVLLEETLDGRRYHVQWFYEHTGGDWRHIPPSADFWGEANEDSTSLIDFEYYEADRALVDVLEPRLNGWWQEACRLTDCMVYPNQPTVRIEPDPLAVPGWAPYDRTTLIIPSPLLGRVPADGSVDPAVLEAVAPLLAERWAEEAVLVRLPEKRNPGPEIAWLQSELAAWLHSAFDEQSGPAEFFTPLVETYDEHMVAKVLDGIPALAAGESIVSVVESATGGSVLDLPVRWDSYFAYRLNEEARMMVEGHPTEAALLFRDPMREPSGMVLDIPTEAFANPGSIAVRGTSRHGEIMWAEVEFTYEQTTTRGIQTARGVTYEPFRLAAGRWVHTWAQLEDWGALRQEQTPHIVVESYELDAATVEGLAPQLEAIYQQAVADYGLVPTEADVFRVIVAPSASDMTSSSIIRPRLLDGVTGTELQIVVPSPHTSVLDPEPSATEQVQQAAAQELLARLLIRRLGTFPANHPFAVALLTWEAEQHRLDPSSVQAAYLDDMGRLGPNWPSDGGDALVFHPPYQDSDYGVARRLLDLLVEQYGPGAVPLLAQNLPISLNLNDWLTRSLGIQFENIQEEWQDAMIEESGQP